MPSERAESSGIRPENQRNAMTDAQRSTSIVDQYDEATVASGFDAAAERYGEVAFLRRSAQALVDALPAAVIGEALDVATGPGTAAILLGDRFPDARVTGVDISHEMVGLARVRADSMRRRNVEFLVGSATGLPFEDASFDLVVCTNAIYYMPDFPRAVAEWARVLRPGGRLAFSTFGTGTLEPMASLFDSRVEASGIVVSRPTPLYRLTSPAACRDLLERAGLEQIRTEERQVGYWVRDAASWWTTLMSTGFRLLVDALDADRRTAFEREHKDEVDEHVTDQGLWLEVPTIVATGATPTFRDGRTS
jgi:ubiquinone/menaquinone biosynthesis C-methylase UbiE